MKTYFLQVQKVVKETNSAVSIHFWHPISEQIKYKAGQFITVIIPDETGKKVKRSYSMSSSPVTDSALAITVKRVEGGFVSNYLNDNIKAGDFIEIVEPLGRFIYDLDSEKNLVLIGAGSGITPLFSIIKSALKTSDKSIFLIYGNRTEDSIIFKKELDELEFNSKGKLKIVYLLSQPSETWLGEKGRINQANTIMFLKQNGIDFKKPLFYMCGPNEMMDEVQKAFDLFEVDKEQIYFEKFNSLMSEEDFEAKVESLSPQEVTVLYDGETHTFKVEPYQTILEAALELDIDLPYSCQAGMCTACLGKCKEGKVKMDEDDGLTEKELAEGYVLTCVAHPLTPGVVIEID